MGFGAFVQKGIESFLSLLFFICSGRKLGMQEISNKHKQFVHVLIIFNHATILLCFFAFMIFAAFSTVLSVFENILAVCMDTFGISRKKAVWINGILLAVLSLPCVLGFNLWSQVHLINGGNVLDSEDFIVSSLLLPIGSLVYLLFCVTKWGWGFDRYLAEANRGSGLKISPKLKPYFQWILPVLIVVILLQGLM